jgi:hypothetical protein
MYSSVCYSVSGMLANLQRLDVARIIEGQEKQ